MKLKFKIFLILFLSITISSSAELRLKSFSPTGGLIYPGSSWKTGFQVGLTADILSLTEAFSIFANFKYWEANYDRDYLSELKLSNLALGTDLRYNIAESGIYLGCGVNQNWLHRDYQGSGLPTEPKQRIGIKVLSGYNISFNDYNSFFTELSYNRVDDYDVIGLQVGLYVYLID